MTPDEIDEALRKAPAWEPPPGFARRVVRASRPREPLTLFGAADAWLQGVAWMLRQYWLLLAR